MKNLFGVMQGRLLPKYKGKYQAHPKNYWSEEFFIASSLGLDCIEFILDFEDYEENPLMNEEGINEINEVISKSGVKVVSICADYFMESPIHDLNLNIRNKNIDVMKKLMENVSLIGVTDIVLPCVDNSSIMDNYALKRFEETVSLLTPYFEDCKINLSLETDLPPNKVLKLLEDLNSPFVKVNYDIGNSAALGYSISDEIKRLAKPKKLESLESLECC